MTDIGPKDSDLETEGSIVYYRLPHANHIFRNTRHCEPLTLASVAELNGREGFVIAPFMTGGDCPVLLLETEWTKMSLEELEQEAHRADSNDNGTDSNGMTASRHNDNGSARSHEATPKDSTQGREEERSMYGEVFRRFHSTLCEGQFDKIVLSRNTTLTPKGRLSPLKLFAKACRRHPDTFVTLFCTRHSGMWLVATPETLIEGQAGDMHTMALAGTMRADCLMTHTAQDHANAYNTAWSDKNIAEQRIVANYITQCVERHATACMSEGPHTVRAGEVAHLRTDISFRLKDTGHIGSLINDLYPTPAVCGMPKAQTRLFIARNENYDRGYYSGFCGIVSPLGHTGLYVTLRCMRIDTLRNACTLYAGGGLLRESDEETEWEETEAKMNTMRQLLTEDV